MSESVLFHGPGSEASCAEEVKAGDLRLLHPPFGHTIEEGRKTPRYLSVDEARQIVDILGSNPVGSAEGVVIVGPMNLASDQSSDVLLKALEETGEGRTSAYLWATDIQGVRPTVVSRCRHVYCPGFDQGKDAMDIAATKAVRYWCSGKKGAAICTLKPYKGQEVNLIGALSSACLESGEGGLTLWREGLRELSLLPNPTWVELVRSFVS